MESVTEALRSLDRDERSMHILHDQLNGSGSFVWTVKCQDDFDFQRLHDVVEQLMAHIQSLRVVITNRPQPHFVEPESPLSCTLRRYERETADSWMAIAESEVNEKFDSDNGPLWRLAVVQTDACAQWELLFICHHVLADGFSSMRFVHQLLSAFSAGQVDADHLQLESGFPLAIEQLLPASQKGAAGFKSTLLCLFDTLRKFSPRLPARRPYVGNARNNVTRYVFATLDAERSQQLKQAAKLQGSGLHGAFLAAQMMAAQALYTDSFPVMSSVTSVNMRPRLPQHASDHLALRVGFLLHAARINEDTDFWQLARLQTADVQQQIDKRYDQTSGAIASWQIKLQTFTPKMLLNNLQLANLGPLLIDRYYDALTIQGVHCMQNFNGMQSALPCIVCSHDGELIFNMGFVQPQYQKQEAQAILDGMVELLCAAC